MLTNTISSFVRKAIAFLAMMLVASALLALLWFVSAIVQALFPTVSLFGTALAAGRAALSALDATLKDVLPEIAMSREASIILLWVAVCAVLCARGLPRIIEQLFLAPFDDRTLVPIRRMTGLLEFHLFAPASATGAVARQPEHSADLLVATASRAEEGGGHEYLAEEVAQHEAWMRLWEWAHRGAGDGRWRPFWRAPDWKGDPALRPFSIAVLTGPNTVGKSQLARELGRALGRRKHLGDRQEISCVRLWRALSARSLRRAAWWAPRHHDDAWDAGLLPAGSLSHVARYGRLAEWRPRYPTLIVLDEPHGDDSRSAIDALARSASTYCHPVRLLVVDQSTPSSLQGVGDEIGVEHVRIDSFRFTVNNAHGLRLASDMPRGSRRESAESTGSARAIERAERRVYRSEDLRRLLLVTDGQPVLVALALLWLREPTNTLDRLDGGEIVASEATLTETQHEAGIHRILAERASELHATLRDNGLNSAGALKAIACATIASGIPLDHARKTFGVDLTVSRLEALFPYATPLLGQMLPPVRPRVVAERLLLDHICKEIGGDRDECLAELVRQGWILNPSGMQRALAELQGKDDPLSLALRTLPEPADSSEALQLASGFAEAAIRQRGDVTAALQLLQASERLMDTERRFALLSRIEALATHPDAAVLSAVALHCTVTASILRTADDPEVTVERALGWLETALPRIESVETEGESDGAAFRAALGGFLDTAPIAALRETEAGCARVDVQILRPLLASCEDLSRQILTRLANPPEGASARARDYSRLWGARSAAQAGDAALCMTYVQRIDRDGDVALRTEALGCVVRAHARAADHGAMEKALEQVEALGGRAEYAAIAAVQLARASAWHDLASANADLERLDVVRDAVERVEAITGRAECSGDAQIQSVRARAWNLLARELAARGDLGAACSAAGRAERVTGQEAFADDLPLQRERVRSWSCLAYAHCFDDIAATRSAVLSAEATAARAKYTSDPWIQLWRTAAWRHLAYAHSRNGDDQLTRAVAGRVEEIAGRSEFENHNLLQRERARAWAHVAECASLRRQAEETEVAVNRVERIAARSAFIEDHLLQLARAEAWCSLSYVHTVRGDLAATRVATNHVERIAARPQYSSDAGLQLARTYALRQLTFCCAAHKDREAATIAADRVEAIAGQSLFADTVEFQRTRAGAWEQVAFAHAAHVDPEATRAALDRVEQIAGREAFSKDAELQLQRASAWRHLCFAHAEWGSTGSAQAAAEHVDAITGHTEFSDDVEHQRVRISAWTYLAGVRSRVGDRVGTQAAVDRVDAIATLTACAGDAEIEGLRLAAWRHLLDVAEEATPGGRRSSNDPRSSRQD